MFEMQVVVSKINQEASVPKTQQETYPLVINPTGLAPLSLRPKLSIYVRQLWQRRFFIWADARSKSFQSTRDYRLWRLWLVLNPLFDVVLYGFLFGYLMRTSRGVENFVGFLFIGITFMKMMNSMMLRGSGLIDNSRSIIRAFAFPKAAIPFSHSVNAVLDNLVPAVVALVAAFVLQPHNPPHWTLLLVIPLYLLVHVFGCGLMMITARLSFEVPDVKALLNLASQAWFFLSGVMYSVDRFKDNRLVHDIMTANPAYIFLTAVRESTIYGAAPSFDIWAKLLAWSLGTFLVGFLFFWKAEEKYARVA